MTVVVNQLMKIALHKWSVSTDFECNRLISPVISKRVSQAITNC